MECDSAHPTSRVSAACVTEGPRQRGERPSLGLVEGFKLAAAKDTAAPQVSDYCLQLKQDFHISLFNVYNRVTLFSSYAQSRNMDYKVILFIFRIFVYLPQTAKFNPFSRGDSLSQDSRGGGLPSPSLHPLLPHWRGRGMPDGPCPHPEPPPACPSVLSRPASPLQVVTDPGPAGVA